MAIKDVLESPRLYQSFQELGGFFGARVTAIKRLLPIAPGQKILDIGCGPGFILDHLPKGISYTGFDIDQTYIDYANARFGDRGSFHCRFFDKAAAAEFGDADIVMMNGVLHHIPDAELIETLRNVRQALKPGGALFTLDGVYAEGQSRVARWLIDNDRGRHVRTAAGYEAILSGVFEKVEPHVFHDISRVPYTFFVAVSRKGDRVGGI